MQRKPAETNETNASANQNAETDAINARLVEVIKANTVRQEQNATERPLLRKLGYFDTARAFLGLIGLMCVAYIYSLLMNKEA